MTAKFEALTLSDYLKRRNPDGSVASVIEAVKLADPVIDQVKWIETNKETGHVTTVRASKPNPKVRFINKGVSGSKSTTRQIEDTCIILEDRSIIDVETLKMWGEKAPAFRASEDDAFVQGFTDVVVKNIFYGNTESNPNTFNGLSVRYNICGGEINTAGYQTISAGVPNESNKNTSIFIVGWGLNNVVGLYPKGTQAGLTRKDKGLGDVYDADGNPYEAMTTLFQWKCGLAVQDIRAAATLRNIDVTNLSKMTSANKLDFMNKLVIAKNRLRNLNNKKIDFEMYVSTDVYDFIENYLLDKNNIYVTQQMLENEKPTLYFKGIRVNRCESISQEEPKIDIAS